MVVVKEPFRYSDDGIHALVCEPGTYAEESLSESALDYCRRHGFIVKEVSNVSKSTDSIRKCGRTKAAVKNRR